MELFRETSLVFLVKSGEGKGEWIVKAYGYDYQVDVNKNKKNIEFY